MRSQQPLLLVVPRAPRADAGAFRQLAQRAEFVEQGNASTPMGRGGTVEEVTAAALYLAVEATFTTGAELPVDGGFSQGLGA